MIWLADETDRMPPHGTASVVVHTNDPATTAMPAATVLDSLLETTVSAVMRQMRDDIRREEMVYFKSVFSKHLIPLHRRKF